MNWIGGTLIDNWLMNLWITRGQPDIHYLPASYLLPRQGAEYPASISAFCTQFDLPLMGHVHYSGWSDSQKWVERSYQVEITIAACSSCQEKRWFRFWERGIMRYPNGSNHRTGNPGVGQTYGIMLASFMAGTQLVKPWSMSKTGSKMDMTAVLLCAKWLIWYGQVVLVVDTKGSGGNQPCPVAMLFINKWPQIFIRPCCQI